MMKNAIERGIHSFVYAITINVVLALIIMAVVNEPDFLPLVPDYSQHFESKYVALLLQFILIGLTSATFGAGSVIFELERWSLLKQSIVYYLITTVIWVPVSIFCWRIDKYVVACITTICSYTVSYMITWMIQYTLCKKSVAKINEKLKEINI